MIQPPSVPRLRGNIVALGLVQIANYAVPLATLPYLARVLGPVAFGQVAFAQILMAYLVLLTDYGFSWSATRKIAARRDDRAYVSALFSGTWMAQWLLLALAAGGLAILVGCSDRLRPEAALYLAAFSIVIGNALFPIWFLQGLERLKPVAVIQVTIRLIALLPIFLFVKSPDDAVLTLTITGGSAMLGGILCLFWMWQQRVLDWSRPSWALVRQELRDGRVLFGSRVAISFYTALVPLVLGWIAGPVAVAHFALADKLRAAAQALLTPLSQALFPRMSHLWISDSGAAFELLKRSALAVLVVAGSASLLLWALADRWMALMGGAEFSAAAGVLRWLAFMPLIVGFSNLLGVQVMLPKQLNAPFNRILTATGIGGLLIVWPLVAGWQATGAAMTVLVTESFVTAAMAVYLWRHRRLFKTHNVPV